MGTSSSIAAVILAGGLGTRLRSVLPDLPKPMASVAGKPFIEWVIRYLVQQGIRHVVISTGYKAEAFDQHFSENPVPGIESLSCVAEPSAQGTAGGFLFGVERSNLRPAGWLVLNGDSLILADLALLCAQPNRAAILAGWMDDASRYGSLDVSSEARLLRFTEKRPGPGWINAGVYLVPHDWVDRLPAKRPLSWETDVFPELLAGGESISVLQVRAPFIDIGIPSSLAEAERFIGENADSFNRS